MDDTGNGAAGAAVADEVPTAENLASSAPRGKRHTRPALTASDRLEILQQAVIDLAHAGIESGATEIYLDGQQSVAIYLVGVHLVDGRIVLPNAINGK